MGCGATTTGTKFVVPDYKECKRVFNEVDADDSKKLNPNELCTALNKAGSNVTVDETIAIMGLLDQNTDKKLDVDEFQHLLYIMKNKQSGNRDLTVFLVADSDMDSMIGYAQMGELIEKLQLTCSADDATAAAKKIAKKLSYEQFQELLV